MRIRIFRAFASNNSGSYTIVGRFDSPLAAEEAAAALRAVCAEHHVWHEEHGWDKDGDSPLEVFAREHGLREARAGREDHWPEHGPAPEIAASGHQVVFHVPYTVTMPTVFGEFFYKRGGRVEVELDHAHHELITDLVYYLPGLRQPNDERRRHLKAFEEELRAVLPGLVAREENDSRPVVAPAFFVGFWGQQRVASVFRDLVPSIDAIRAIATRHGVELNVRITECPCDLADPLAPLRESKHPWGNFRVILWSIGEDRLRALKAVRDTTNTGLAEARAALEALPTEVLVDVDRAFAERAVENLKAAGCDAEVVLPRKG